MYVCVCMYIYIYIYIYAHIYEYISNCTETVYELVVKYLSKVVIERLSLRDILWARQYWDRRAVSFAYKVMWVCGGRGLCVFIYIYIYIYIYNLVIYLTTGPNPRPKRAVHIVRSKASSFKWEYPLLSLRSSSSFLRLLPRLPVTSITLSSFPQ